MVRRNHSFDDDEIAYLKTLPVVDSVGRTRIRYTTQFREYCMQRYREGGSPAEIFREAGLEPALIGHKRIERCIARWKEADPSFADGGGRRQRARTHDAATVQHDSPQPSAASRGETEDRAALLKRLRKRWGGGLQSGDLRDMLIIQQIRYIDELTQERDRLRAENARLAAMVAR